MMSEINLLYLRSYYVRHLGSELGMALCAEHVREAPELCCFWRRVQRNDARKYEMDTSKYV